jgi:hypothetical protein
MRRMSEHTIPEIHIENNMYVLYGVTSLKYGKNAHSPKTLREGCYYSVGYYVCRRERDIWRDLLVYLMRKGYTKIRICRNARCNEVEL